MRRFIYPLLLILMVFAVYANSLHGEFVFDDQIIVLSFDVLSVHTLAEALDVHGSRDLLFATYRLNYLFGGTDPFGYHVVNMVIHALNVLLIYAILQLLVIDRRYSFFGAATFAAHTLFSGSVAYVSGRSSLLCATFYFLAVYFFIKALELRKARWPGWLFLAILAGSLSWRVKQEAIALPIMLAVIVIWKSGYWRTALAFAAIPLAIVVALRAEIAHMYDSTARVPELLRAGLDQALPIGAYLPTYITAVVGYMLPRFIAPLNLSIDPEIASVAHWYSLESIVSFLIIAALLALAVVVWKDHPLLTLGIVAVFASPLAAYAFVPLADVVQEHRLYIPGLGIAIIASWLVQWTDRHLRLRWALIVPVVAILAVMTHQRNEVWASEVSILQDASLRAPTKARPHFNLGEALQKRSEMLFAMTQYDIALRLNPTLHAARSNLASIHMDLGAVAAHNGNGLAAAQWYDSAERLLIRVVDESPEYPEARINLAVLYLRTNRAYVAEKLLTTLAIDYPENFGVHFNLGQALEQLNEPKVALTEYRIAQTLRPDMKLITETIDRLNGKPN